ncbi:MAG: hypothetical protein WA159_05605, partial [Variovorax sp.]
MVITMVISTTSVAPKLRDSSLRKEEWNNIVERKKRIMDFQLKTLSTAQAATDKTDALIVLVADGAKAAAPSRTDALATAVEAVRQAGDLPAK